MYQTVLKIKGYKTTLALYGWDKLHKSYIMVFKYNVIVIKHIDFLSKFDYCFHYKSLKLVTIVFLP